MGCGSLSGIVDKYKNQLISMISLQQAGNFLNQKVSSMKNDLQSTFNKNPTSYTQQAFAEQIGRIQDTANKHKISLQQNILKAQKAIPDFQNYGLNQRNQIFKMAGDKFKTEIGSNVTRYQGQINSAFSSIPNIPNIPNLPNIILPK